MKIILSQGLSLSLSLSLSLPLSPFPLFMRDTEKTKGDVTWMFESQQQHRHNCNVAGILFSLFGRSQTMTVTNKAKRCRYRILSLESSVWSSNASHSQIYIFIFQAPALMINLEILNHRLKHCAARTGPFHSLQDGMSWQHGVDGTCVLCSKCDCLVSLS